MLVSLNGTFIPHEDAQLSITDGGFLYGDTLFETLKAQGTRILLLNEHLDRLQLSARLLNFPCDRQRIETACQQLAAALTAPLSRIRLTLSRGSHQRLALPGKEKGWFLLTATEMSEITTEERQAGAICVLAPNQRVNPLDHLPQMKRGNYVDCLYAADYARQQGAREALFIDPDGFLQEGSTSNLFALLDDRLVTPPIDKTILAGIMRREVIDAATELGILVVERKLHMEEVTTAEEVFLSNSLIDVFPVSSIDGQSVRRGSCWEMILKTVQLRIET